MKHLTQPSFWRQYKHLPLEVQRLADKNYELLKLDPCHSSLHFKKVGKSKQLWSVRVSDKYRALGLDVSEGVLWVWIGVHAEYDQFLK